MTCGFKGTILASKSSGRGGWNFVLHADRTDNTHHAHEIAGFATLSINDEWAIDLDEISASHLMLSVRTPDQRRHDGRACLDSALFNLISGLFGPHTLGRLSIHLRVTSTSVYKMESCSNMDVGGHRKTAALYPEPAYTPRGKIRIATVGAGFSGLIFAYKLQHEQPEFQDLVDHTILEARADLGGTWLVNRYPGVQCDVPAHIYVSYSHSTRADGLLDSWLIRIGLSL